MVVVAGGLLVVGGALVHDDGDDMPPAELFDETSGRWFMLPHPMAEPRWQARLVSLPAAALTTPPMVVRAGGAVAPSDDENLGH